MSRAEEANKALAARLGVEYDPVKHRPSGTTDGRAVPTLEIVTTGADEQTAAATERVRESSGAHLVETPTGIESAGRSLQGWRMVQERITQRRTDLNLMDQERMLLLVLKLWDQNPLARRLIQRKVNYCLGEGFEVVARHEDEDKREDIQKVLDRTIGDHRNSLKHRFPRWAAAYFGFGEMPINTTVNEANGLVRFAYMSPFQIVNVFTEREDAEQIDVIAMGRKTTNETVLLKHIRVDEDGEVQKWLEAYEEAKREWRAEGGMQLEAERARLTEAKSRLDEDGAGELAAVEALVTRLREVEAEIAMVPTVQERVEARLLEGTPEHDTARLLELAPADYDADKNDPATANLIRLGRNMIDGAIDGESEEIPRRAGKALYFGANTIPGMVRGRSDLLAIADILDAYDRLLWLGLERRALISAFVWDVEITGATQPMIDEWWEKNPPPEPGTIRVHNEREKWTAVTPNLNSHDEQGAGDTMLSYIATGIGFPRTWVGGADDPNRASAVEMSTPTMKDMTASQRELRTILEEMFKFVIDQAVLHGELPEDTPSDAFEVQMPDLSVNDTVKAASTFQAVMTAFMALLNGSVIDKHEVQEAFAILAPSLGYEPDLETMRKRLEEAKEEMEQQMQQGGAYGPGGPPPPPGIAAPPGQPGAPPPPQQGQRPTTQDGTPRQAGQGDARGAGASRAADRDRTMAEGQKAAGQQQPQKKRQEKK